MLSKSNAAADRVERERFSKPSVSLWIVLAFVLLLFALFPEKGIIETMGRSSERNPLALVYREAILRTRPGDMEMRLKLAEDLTAVGQYARARGILDGAPVNVPEPLRRRYLRGRCMALRGFLAIPGIKETEKKTALMEFSATVGELAAVSPESLERDVPVAAADSGKPDSCRANSRLFFASMNRAAGVTERRALLMTGVRSLQACNLAGEALAAGAAHMSGLESDRQALLFMTNTALAAGKPGMAEYFITKALDVDHGRKSGGGG